MNQRETLLLEKAEQPKQCPYVALAIDLSLDGNIDKFRIDATFSQKVGILCISRQSHFITRCKCPDLIKKEDLGGIQVTDDQAYSLHCFYLRDCAVP
jgi:hypothetical protein